MSLYDQWKDLLEHMTESDVDEFQKEYYEKEEKLYQALLSKAPQPISGSFEALAQTYDFQPHIFAGFMDGVNDSLKKPYDLKKLRETTEISLEVDYEKLYFNMLEAKAHWLYNLPEWDNALSQEKRSDIAKQFRLSKQAVSTKIDRNAPCPCGSGKKYKKCCGLNA